MIAQTQITVLLIATIITIIIGYTAIYQTLSQRRQQETNHVRHNFRPHSRPVRTIQVEDLTHEIDAARVAVDDQPHAITFPEV